MRARIQEKGQWALCVMMIASAELIPKLESSNNESDNNAIIT